MAMENAAIIGFVSVLLLVLLESGFCDYGLEGFVNPMKLMKEELSKDRANDSGGLVLDASAGYWPVHISSQDGLKESDKIKNLPGQPEGIEFDQYSGYVTVDAKAGRALFYYFVESLQNSSSKPLVLWLNGGPGCSSVGSGALMELGPFRVNQDGKTLYRNEYAWNKVANILFLESPAGVGFSYSNTTSDYESTGDKRTAQDSYAFLVNWLERFPEYKARDFYITGESYAGHYIPQLAQAILQNNKHTNQTRINLKGVAMGNAYIDFETTVRGAVDFFWTHALISDDIYKGLISHCNFNMLNSSSVECKKFIDEANEAAGKILNYDIYAPICNSSLDSMSVSTFDPCSQNYISSYLNIPEVQKALHANVTALPSPWRPCSGKINKQWKDKPLTVLPIIQELMDSGLSVWMYSGDTDGAIPVTSTRYSINKLGTPIRTAWYPWYTQGEVGGYVVGYENLTFMTIRGSGHFVPSYQPARAMVLFSSFINGKLPPAA